MMREKIRNWLQSERKKLATMSTRKKADYIWTYYKWWILGAAMLVVFAVSGIQNAQYQNRPVLISGIFVNTSTSAEGYAYVKEDYLQYADPQGTGRVELIESYTVDYYAEQPGSTDVNAIMGLDAMIASRTLDYMICDAATLERFDKLGFVLDLETMISQEELSRWNTVQSENGTVAIDLTGSSYEMQFGLGAEPAYIFVLDNTERPDNCVDFIRYLFQKK